MLVRTLTPRAEERNLTPELVCREDDQPGWNPLGRPPPTATLEGKQYLLFHVRIELRGVAPLRRRQQTPAHVASSARWLRLTQVSRSLSHWRVQGVSSRGRREVVKRYRVIDTTLESSEPPPQKLPTPPPPDEAPFAVFEARIQRISFPREEDRMLEAKLESHDPTVRPVPRPLDRGAAILLAPPNRIVNQTVDPKSRFRKFE